MADNNTAHIFLTGYSIKEINDFSIINDSDFVITTNFGVLHKYIAGRANAYFVNNSGNIRLIVNARLCIKTADANTKNNCIFYVKKSYEKFIQSTSPNRNYVIVKNRVSWLSRFNKIIKIESSTAFSLFKLVDSMGYNEIYLWGADYILEEPIHRHFYEFTHVKEKQPEEFSLAIYSHIKSTFNMMRIKHICPKNSKSHFFESVYVK